MQNTIHCTRTIQGIGYQLYNAYEDGTGRYLGLKHYDVAHGIWSPSEAQYQDANQFGQYYVGWSERLNSGTVKMLAPFLCIEHGQRLSQSGDDRYYVRDILDIRGTVATAASGTVVDARENAVLCKILQNKLQTGYYWELKGDEPVQNALWTYINTWKNVVANRFTTLSNIIVSNNDGNPAIYGNIINEAEAYANSIANSGLQDATNKNNITVTPYEVGEETYVRVGPFTYTFGGTLNSVTLIDNNNKEIAPSGYGRYIGSEYTTISNANQIASGTEFYVDFKIEDSSTIKKVKVSKSMQVCKVKVVFFEASTRANWQNLISHGMMGEETDVEEKEFDYEIPLLGTIDISKIDPDNSNMIMANVGFTLKMIDGSKAGQYVSVKNGNEATYQQEETTILTNNEGKLNIKYLYPGIYELKETVNPYYGYDVGDVKVIEITIKPGQITYGTVENKRKWIKLSGIVWEDILYSDGKGYDSNNLYKNGQLDTEDKELEHVTVRLRHMTDSSLERETTTDVNGSYLFEDVLIDELKNFYIEFEYNGMSYQSIPIDPQELGVNDANYVAQDGYEDVRSKAEEGEARTEFNANYAIITNGQSNNANGEKIYDLSYDRENYKSTLTYGENAKDSDAFGYEGQKYPITKVDSQYLMSATTLNAYDGGLDNILVRVGNDDSYNYVKATAEQVRANGVEEISHINLGVQEREQPDLAIVKDIQSAKVTINEKEHIYDYNDRFQNVASEDELYNMDVSIKFGNNSRNMPYTRALYESDIRYGDESKKLEVRVTYKIGIKNTSTSLLATVNTIDDYFDNKYQLIAVGTQINADGSVVEESKLNCTKPEAYNNEYQKVVITTNATVSNQSEQFVYIEFKVQGESLSEIVDDGTDNEVKLDNVVEISSYSVYDTNNEVYAGIDIDAEPGNVDVTAITTYEDDTDIAKGLKLVLQEKRSTSGTVFEDSAILLDGVDESEVNTGEIREGSGTYEDRERLIEGIEVTLIDEEGNTVQVYDEEAKTWVDGKAITDENGAYEISGYIPGDYQIKYTWGGQTSDDGTTYTVQDYKSTVVDQTVWNDKSTEGNQDKWYKDTFKQEHADKEWDTETNTEIRTSDAIDDYTRREEIDEETKELNHEIISDIEDAYNQPEGSSTITTKIDSYTPEFTVSVEYNTDSTDSSEEYETDEDGNVIMDGSYAVKKDGHKNELKSIDFGIIERARQEISVDKLVRQLTLTLADGRILANIEVDEDGNATTKTRGVAYVPPTDSDPGLVRVEIDNEYLQGTTVVATYEIRISNTSEKDYVDEEYYLYGIVPSTEDNVVKLTPTKVVDYVDSSWTLSSDTSNEWVTKQLNEVKNENLVTDEAEEAISDSSVRVLYTDTLNTQQLSPGSDTSLFTTFSKLLTTTDEISFSNEVEIIYVSKTGGSILHEEIPGNYEPGLGSQEEDDAQASQAIIVPATGANLNYLPLVTLIISSCLILVTGTILIKKLVLGKR